MCACRYILCRFFSFNINNFKNSLVFKEMVTHYIMPRVPKVYSLVFKEMVTHYIMPRVPEVYSLVFKEMVTPLSLKTTSRKTIWTLLRSVHCSYIDPDSDSDPDSSQGPRF